MKRSQVLSDGHASKQSPRDAFGASSEVREHRRSRREPELSSAQQSRYQITAYLQAVALSDLKSLNLRDLSIVEHVPLVRRSVSQSDKPEIAVLRVGFHYLPPATQQRGSSSRRSSQASFSQLSSAPTSPTSSLVQHSLLESHGSSSSHDCEQLLRRTLQPAQTSSSGFELELLEESARQWWSSHIACTERTHRTAQSRRSTYPSDSLVWSATTRETERVKLAGAAHSSTFSYSETLQSAIHG